MSNIYNATNEHVPFSKKNEDKKKEKVAKDRIGRHPNKGLNGKHPVSGK